MDLKFGVGGFDFNGKKSSDFKLVCKSIKKPLLPAVKVKRTEFSGLNGVYDANEPPIYGLRNVVVSISYIGSDYEELRNKAREIAGWLSSPVWSKLIFNDEPHKYYMAKITDEVDLKSLYTSGSAEVIFDCLPFAIGITEIQNELNVSTSEYEGYIENPGNVLIDYRSPEFSQFKVFISGSWNNNFEISVIPSRYGIKSSPSIIIPKAGSGNIVIDNINLTVTLDNTNMLNDIKLGFTEQMGFLLLGPGQSSIRIKNANNVSVKTIFSPLWL